VKLAKSASKNTTLFAKQSQFGNAELALSLSVPMIYANSTFLSKANSNPIKANLKPIFTRTNPKQTQITCPDAVYRGTQITCPDVEAKRRSRC
jgi:hypothetical protein